MFVILALLLQLFAVVFAIANLVFFILVLVQMFKRDQSTMGIVCIVLSFCGIGMLVTFVFGWMKATEWNIKKIMMSWTAVVVVEFLVAVVIVIASLLTVGAAIEQEQFDPNNLNFEFDIDESNFEMPEGFDMPDGATFDEPTTDAFAEPVESATE